MKQKINKITPFAVLSISLVLTSGMAINGTLPLIKKQLELSQTKSELLSTIPSLTVIIFVVLSNMIVKKIGMKRTVILGLFLVAIGGSIPVIVSTNYYLLIVSRLILGAGLGCYNSSSVNYINELFVGNTRMTLLGIRNSMESIGQMFLTYVAGLLIAFGWQVSYLIYLSAIPIAIIFYLFVPNVTRDENQVSNQKAISWLPILSVLFAGGMIMNSIAIAVRFPALAISLKTASFNTSNYLAMMPILGIVSGFLFQRLTSFLKHRILYLALLVNITANLLIAISYNSFYLLVIGLMLSSIPVAWVLPYLFNHIEVLANGMDTRSLTAYIFLGCNLGVLVAPILMKVIEVIGRTSNLYFPFYVFAGFFFGVIFGVQYVHKNLVKKIVE